MRYDVECPYCEEGQEINHDDGYGYEDGEIHHQECSCGKTFTYTTSVSYHYEVAKAPCFNEEPHDWKDIHGYPAGYQSNRKHCSYCDKIELKDPTLEYLGAKEDRWVKKNETDNHSQV